ncbi:AI-2E family transporter [bacterium]|nr:MAG: AI-2E family transporter [bacterium]
MTRNHVFAALLFLSVALCVYAALPFVPALLWATTLAILSRPLVRRFARFGETGSALIATLVTGLILAIPLLMIGVGLGLQVSNVADQLHGKSLETLISDAERALMPIAERFGIHNLDLQKALRENGGALAASVRPAATRFVVGAGATLLTLVVALLTQFFLLRDGHRLREPAISLSPLTPDRTEALLERTAETVRAVFIGTVLVAAIQGAIMGVAFWAAGLTNALLLGVVSAVLCIIPLLGAPVLYLPIGLGLLATGNTKGGLIVLGVGLIVVSQVDNVMKPFLISGRANLHPMAIFFAILGGTLLFGPIGVMAGPMLLTVTLGLLDGLREKINGNADPVESVPVVH